MQKILEETLYTFLATENPAESRVCFVRSHRLEDAMVTASQQVGGKTVQLVSTIPLDQMVSFLTGARSEVVESLKVPEMTKVPPLENKLAVEAIKPITMLTKGQSLDAMAKMLKKEGWDVKKLKD